jgi:hypothetical protein
MIAISVILAMYCTEPVHDLGIFLLRQALRSQRSGYISTSYAAMAKSPSLRFAIIVFQDAGNCYFYLPASEMPSSVSANGLAFDYSYFYITDLAYRFPDAFMTSYALATAERGNGNRRYALAKAICDDDSASYFTRLFYLRSKHDIAYARVHAAFVADCIAIKKSR